jgi:hypothetical protein
MCCWRIATLVIGSLTFVPSSEWRSRGARTSPHHPLYIFESTQFVPEQRASPKQYQGFLSGQEALPAHAGIQ